MDLPSRIRAYVSQMDPAIEGMGGCHDTTFKVALALVKGFDLSPEEALPFMEDYNGRCVPPWSQSELRHKLRSALSAPDRKERGYLLKGEKKPLEEPGVAKEPVARREKPKFDLAKLKVFAGGCREVVDRTWLAERSPLRVEWGNRAGLAVDVLSFLFPPEDLVLMFKRKWSQGDFGVWKNSGFRLSRERGVKAVRSEIPTESNAGMCLMACPVDGQWRIKPGQYEKDGRPKWTRRSASCVTRFPYLVLESDDAPMDLWLRALVQMELRIAAVFSSGGKSVHALVRIDARSKTEFDACGQVVASVMKGIGADENALKGLPMSRVPGIKRIETGRIQELWYLNPDPGWGRLLDLKRLRSVETGNSLTKTGGG